MAAVLLLLFAIGHTLGFSQSDPHWGVDALLASMRSLHVNVQGFNRTLWDFFLAAGLTVGMLYTFAAVLAWQMGGMPSQTLVQLRGLGWLFALTFGFITLLSLRYLFIIPIAFSAAITVCLTAAAWLASKSAG